MHVIHEKENRPPLDHWLIGPSWRSIFFSDRTLGGIYCCERAVELTSGCHFLEEGDVLSLSINLQLELIRTQARH